MALFRAMGMGSARRSLGGAAASCPASSWAAEAAEAGRQLNWGASWSAREEGTRRKRGESWSLVWPIPWTGRQKESFYDDCKCYVYIMKILQSVTMVKTVTTDLQLCMTELLSLIGGGLCGRTGEHTAPAYLL